MITFWRVFWPVWTVLNLALLVWNIEDGNAFLAAINALVVVLSVVNSAYWWSIDD